jgi:hypothetical protein
MQPLTLDDLVPLDEFANNRREYFQSHLRYVDRYRRVRVGPLATLVFENRQTLWFRVQEVLRIARLADPQSAQRELDLFNLILPAGQQLQAALLIEINSDRPLTEQLAPWNRLEAQHLRLCLGPSHYGAKVVTCRPEDRCMGASHWVQFQLDDRGQDLLGDFSQSAAVEITLQDYSHRGPQLGEEVRQSLVDDLRLK